MSVLEAVLPVVFAVSGLAGFIIALGWWVLKEYARIVKDDDA